MNATTHHTPFMRQALQNKDHGFDLIGKAAVAEVQGNHKEADRLTNLACMHMKVALLHLICHEKERAA